MNSLNDLNNEKIITPPNNNINLQPFFIEDTLNNHTILANNNIQENSLSNNNKIIQSESKYVTSSFINNRNHSIQPLIRKKKSQNKIDTKNYKEIDIVLDLYTKILKKEDAEKCICNNSLEETDLSNVNNTNDIIYEREIISNLNFLVHQNDKIKLFDVTSRLKSCGFPLTGSMISIYSKLAEDYIFVGADPVDQNFFLSNTEYNLKLIKLKAICYIEEKLIHEINREHIFCKPLSRRNSLVDKKKSKRTKERKIGFIIEKVNSWRKLYNGFYDDNGKFTKYSLDEAAKIISISKKSLDDYLLQLRLGRKFGFDFNLNKNCKVGILRSFVKQNRGQKPE